MNLNFESWEQQANTLSSEAEMNGLIVAGDLIDHLGIKCLSTQEYVHLKNKLSQVAALLGEARINGRLISSFRLEKPLLIAQQSVWVLELAAPKPREQKQGFDHLEIVIKESFDKRRDRLKNGDWQSVRWPSLINPELSVSLGSGILKFHFQSLEKVIALEEQYPEILEVKVPEVEDYDTWVFDLDGTLISSFDSIIDGVWLYTKKKGLALNRSQVLEAARSNYEDYLEVLEGESPQNSDLQLLSECEALCTQSVLPLRPIIELLRQVKTRGKNTVLWTARFRPSVETILARFSLSTLFDRTITSTEVKKPSSIPWLSTLGNSAILLGDSDSDVRAAEINGLDFIKVPKTILG